MILSNLFQVPVLISDLDMECKLWIKLRLAPICPWLGTISLAFVGAPNVKVRVLGPHRHHILCVLIAYAMPILFAKMLNAVTETKVS